MHIYELGYGSHEESEYTVLSHEKEFTKKEFDNMVFECVVKTSKIEFDKYDALEYKQKTAEDAVLYRQKGEEFMYESCMDALLNSRAVVLTYQNLHKQVVQFMKDDFCFQDIHKAATIRFFGWADLSDENDWDLGETEPHRTASKMVREHILSRTEGARHEPFKERFEFKKDRNSRLAANAAEVYAEDKVFIESLGVTYVPFDDPDASEARRKVENW